MRASGVACGGRRDEPAVGADAGDAAVPGAGFRGRETLGAVHRSLRAALHGGGARGARRGGARAARRDWDAACAHRGGGADLGRAAASSRGVAGVEWPGRRRRGDAGHRRCDARAVLRGGAERACRGVRALPGKAHLPCSRGADGAAPGARCADVPSHRAAAGRRGAAGGARGRLRRSLSS